MKSTSTIEPTRTAVKIIASLVTLALCRTIGIAHAQNIFDKPAVGTFPATCTKSFVGLRYDSRDALPCTAIHVAFYPNNDFKFVILSNDYNLILAGKMPDNDSLPVLRLADFMAGKYKLYHITKLIPAYRGNPGSIYDAATSYSNCIRSGRSFTCHARHPQGPQFVQIGYNVIINMQVDSR
jgi:hypothetical protein